MEQIDDIEGTIVRNEPVIPGYYRAIIELSRPMGEVKPGQFTMIKVPSSEVFLRRPFSIYDYKDMKLSLLYKVVGKGTSELAATPVNSKTMLLGPLGNGFTLLEEHRPVLLGGGIGIAGLYLLWSQLKDKATLLWGGVSATEVDLIKEMMRSNPHIATMDGSLGHKGTVVDLLRKQLVRLKAQGPVQIFACGPHAMFANMKALLNEERLSCQVLLEERMACGLGLCFGCVTKTTDEKEPYQRVCKEGPVFDLWQISL